jgi:membrane protein implicated in regulation of membrane protease activity
MPYYYVWLTLAVIFIIIEIFSAGFFYACFAVGALAAWVTSLVTGSIIWQIVIFCIVSVALIPVSRIFARRVTDHSVPQAGVDALIGLTGVVTENIRPAEDVGKVRVDNQGWRAVATEDIDAGTKIRVTAIKGARLVVETVDEKGVNDE